MSKIRVVVAEDSISVRKYLCSVLQADPDFEVVGEAPDGKRAFELCRELRPDIVTMDMMMPVMTGLSATESIMGHCPTPILIVSSSTNRGELFKAYDALHAGAVDVLEKPRGDDTDAAWEVQFLSTVKLVSRIRVITHLKGRLASRGISGESAPRTPGSETSRPRVEAIAIGVSTGGPAALVRILRDIEPRPPIPILVVLHLGEAFAPAFAEWLCAQVGHEVRYARDGERCDATKNRVIMAPPGVHLAVQGGRFRLTTEAERHSCRPSVDVLFESVAREFGSRAVGCILTGMGRDGAAGLLAIRRAGGSTIAQDEATSVVYGMPREAMLIGAAERILPLDEIGSALRALQASAGEVRP